MPSLLDFLPMLARQQVSSQVLEREAEQDEVTDTPENIVQYDRVMATKLAIAYGAGLEIIHRARSGTPGGIAMDLACGPGHYTLCLARYLGYGRVVGLDLSPGMVEVARKNAADQRLQDRVEFQVGDVTCLRGVVTRQIDLASFTDAAHHMPGLRVVRRVLSEMDRITKPDGLVMLMDLVRLKTEPLTERYVNTMGHDYVERGLPNFLQEFRASMYAAWTSKELREAIPRDTQRYWCHIVPRGLPTVQVILGLPVGRRKVFLRSGVPWSREDCPVPEEMRLEWRMLRMTLAVASKKLIPPGA